MKHLPAILLVLATLVGCANTATSPTSASTISPVNGTRAINEALRVVTTMSILADVIKQVGGERVLVENIVPPGSGPEDYQATPGDSQKIAHAQIVFFNGHGLEEWLEPLFANAAAPDQPRIELSAGMPAIEGGNPHFWLDPANMMTYTATIRDELSTLDPASAATYAANAQAYIDQLALLDQELQAQASQIPAERRKLVTNHDAFPYFARRYGFEVVGVLLENPEAELAAGDLSRLVETIKAQGVPAIFAESQFNQKTAQLLADEAGIKTIAVLYTDTLGNTEAGTYLEMMRSNMRTVVEALK